MLLLIYCQLYLQYVALFKELILHDKWSWCVQQFLAYFYDILSYAIYYTSCLWCIHLINTVCNSSEPLAARKMQASPQIVARNLSSGCFKEFRCLFHIFLCINLCEWAWCKPNQAHSECQFENDVFVSVVVDWKYILEDWISYTNIS